MSECYRFDVIVIGGGPAGIACAYKLAKAGKNALVIDRGAKIGGKNLTGGRLYTYALEMIEPGLFKQAALERKVVREKIMILGSDKEALTMDYYNQVFSEEIPNSYTILRANFDEWFAAHAEKNGVTLVDGIKVDELIEKDGNIVGIKAGEDIAYADVVVAADGVNSLFAEQAGLRSKVTSHQVGVGVKEVISLPAKVIEERFNVKPGEGVSSVILGGTEGVVGGGFLYTNKESVSLGFVLSPDKMAKLGKPIYELFQEYKMHPAIYSLIGDGESIEYGAHLVPEAGWRGVPSKLYRNGLLVAGDAAGFVINTGTIIRGIDLAMLSGIAAANAIIAAPSITQVGPNYMVELEKIKLIATMKLYAGWTEITGNPRMASAYPAVAAESMRFMFSVDGNVPEKMPKAMMNIMNKHVSLGQLAADGWKGFRAI